MKSIKRYFDPRDCLRKSFFLLGPRSVGKSTLLQEQIRAERYYDLNRLATYQEFIKDTDKLYKECLREKEIVVIDEIQKLPNLLNEVQRCIDKFSTKFILSGSSARKLRHQNANLLGGRASQFQLFPLCYPEIKDFDLKRYLNRGGIPRHYLIPEKEIMDELNDYVSLYLKEEIAQEALTRNLEGFSRFLEVMALHSGDEIVYEAFSSDCGIKVSTFRNYVDILFDTLLAFEVPAYQKTKIRKAITRSKIYLFDVGVTNFLSHRENVTTKSEALGKAFENFIALELRAYLKYKKKNLNLCYWRSTSQHEVDFLVGDSLAIEVKGAQTVHERHLKGLQALGEEKIFKKYILVSLAENTQKVGNITILNWKVFLDKLWGDELVG